jgi:hypothetical protein
VGEPQREKVKNSADFPKLGPRTAELFYTETVHAKVGEIL